MTSSFVLIRVILRCVPCATSHASSARVAPASKSCALEHPVNKLNKRKNGPGAVRHPAFAVVSEVQILPGPRVYGPGVYNLFSTLGPSREVRLHASPRPDSH